MGNSPAGDLMIKNLPSRGREALQVGALFVSQEVDNEFWAGADRPSVFRSNHQTLESATSFRIADAIHHWMDSQQFSFDDRLGNPNHKKHWGSVYLDGISRRYSGAGLPQFFWSPHH